MGFFVYLRRYSKVIQQEMLMCVLLDTIVTYTSNVAIRFNSNIHEYPTA